MTPLVPYHVTINGLELADAQVRVIWPLTIAPVRLHDEPDREPIVTSLRVRITGFLPRAVRPPHRVVVDDRSVEVVKDRRLEPAEGPGVPWAGEGTARACRGPAKRRVGRGRARRGNGLLNDKLAPARAPCPP